jgi:peroxiredoxin
LLHVIEPFQPRTQVVNLRPRLLCLLALLALPAVAQEEELDTTEPTAPTPSSPEVPTAPRAPAPSVAFTLTAHAASASALWPRVWAEGDAERRTEMEALEGRPAPPLSVDRWARGEPVTLEALRGSPVILAFWGVWNETGRASVEAVARAVAARSSMNARLITVHPDEASQELSEYIAHSETDFPIAIDRDHETVRAYHVDSDPDYYLIGPDGRLLCGDIANSHVIEALDALSDGWNP